MRPLTYLYGRIPLHHHEHVAILHRTREEAFRGASFLAEGLKHNNLCVYLAPDDYQTEMLGRLRALPLDVDCHTREGRLRVHRGSDTLELLQQWTQAVFDDAERAAVPSLRWLEEGLWPAGLGFPMPHFFEFHALLNYQVKHYPSVALCQYDLERIETPHLLTALAVHRHLVVEGTLVRDNPFYVPVEKFLPMSPAEREQNLLRLFRDVEFDVTKLLAALTGYAQVQQALSKSPQV